VPDPDVEDAPKAEVRTFTFGSAPIRTVLRDGEPWWIAADVCAVLALGNPR
jgi:prophage antirepressor-like protein